jgi:hypothetical protein
LLKLNDLVNLKTKKEMKKRIFACMAILALITSVSLTSCSKEDPAKAVNFDSYALEQGTIEGIAYAKYDDSSDAPQFAPNGTVIFLTVSFDALGIDASNGETKQLQTTVNAGGKFSFSGIPLNRYKATSVTINGQSYVSRYTFADGMEEVDGVWKTKYTTKDYKFTASQTSVSLQPGGKNFITITYNPSGLFQ